jgi:hypothetical protein
MSGFLYAAPDAMTTVRVLISAPPRSLSRSGDAAQSSDSTSAGIAMRAPNFWA